MGVIKDETGKRVKLGKELGRGGEGAVFEVAGNPGCVAKVFFDDKRAKYEVRLREMLPNPPQDQTRNLTPPHISISWPEHMLFEDGAFIGYTMPRIQWAPDIYKVYSPKMRKVEYPKFDWRHLHHTALNLAIAVHSYHIAGYVIGDLNSKNVLVNQNAMVTMVDADSIQICTASGKVLRCMVGTPDFTPPELQGIHLDSVDRNQYHDSFGLAVMIFHLLMEGLHPFSGTPLDPKNSVAGPIYQYCIKNGIFPYTSNKAYKPPVNAPEFKNLHPDLQKLFLRCFVDGHKDPSKRPLPIEWYKALQTAEGCLVQCQTVKQHWYSNHLKACPWCKREKALAVRRTKQRATTTRVAPPVATPATPVPLQRPMPPTPAPTAKPGAPTRTPRVPTRPASPPPIFKPASPVSRGQFQNTIAWRWAKKYGWVALLLLLAGFTLFFALNNNDPLRKVRANVPMVDIFPDERAEDQDINEPQEPAAEEPQLAVEEQYQLPPVDEYCPNAPGLRVAVDDVVEVAVATSLRGRGTPEIRPDNIIMNFPSGTLLLVEYGPVCGVVSDQVSYWFWLVSDEDGNLAWVAEGDFQSFFIQKAN